ncbi:MAG: hypothetical protein U5L75_03525 [Candidatus Campbellbacteria bacterium]|nr:hypothetical protein [Candidatus Campbellbacteria bacterium]
MDPRLASPMTREEQTQHSFGEEVLIWTCAKFLEPGDIVLHPSGGIGNDPKYMTYAEDGSFIETVKTGNGRFVRSHDVRIFKPKYHPETRLWKVGDTPKGKRRREVKRPTAPRTQASIAPGLFLGVILLNMLF